MPSSDPMNQSVIPQLIELVSPLAKQLNLELVDIVFHTNKNPPVLRVDIRNLTEDTGLEDCEQMSRTLETELEEQEIINGAYVLEVSSPGIATYLTSDREFTSFKGFAVILKTSEPFKKKTEWQGTLLGRDQDAVYLNQKGKKVTIPRDLVVTVQFDEHN